MYTDSTQIEVSLRILIDTYWQDEKRHFEEIHDHSFGDCEDTLDRDIEWCQENRFEDHPFYHLMILKSSLGDDFADEDAPDSFDNFDIFDQF